jgi:hypothetical protein
MEFNSTARRLGLAAAMAVVGLSTVYTVTLTIALMSLSSFMEPVTGPMFSMLEILLFLTMLCIVALMVAVHAWAAPAMKVFSLIALIFTALLAGLTLTVHFVILVVGRNPAFADASWQLVLSFRWPSIVYAIDILAWDVCFSLAALFVAPVFRGSRLANWIRVLMFVSGGLALAGLSGVIAGDMRLRNIGIVGYAVVFPVAALLIAILFKRSSPRSSADPIAAAPNAHPT